MSDVPESGNDLTSLEGIGDKTAGRLGSLGIFRAEDLLFFFPRIYQDRTSPKPISALIPGNFSTVQGQVLSLSERKFHPRGTLEILLTDGRGVVSLKWFRYGKWLRKSLEKKFPPGTIIAASGKVSVYNGKLEIHHPDVALGGSGGDTGIVPIYPLTEGLGQHTIRRGAAAALRRYLPAVKEWIPEEILAERGLPELKTAVMNLHNPPPDQDIEVLNAGLTPWHDRVRFGELFAFQLGLLSRRMKFVSRTSRPVKARGALEERFLSGLPFRLTASQEKALKVIGRDMEGNTPMHRLLQGEVGSGKTLVAFIAMLWAVAEGRQAVLMVPTEVLAEQHFRTFSGWCRKIGIEVGLFTGSMGDRERSHLRVKSAEGSVGIIVGTHALIQEGVRFGDLALAVVDVQHRFGVLQRLALKEKGESPHFLVMTATPIPRSLSLVIYGDLDITTIDELPEGRKPVKTVLFEESDRSRMYLKVAREVSAGGQVYIVYPLVEESEKLELLAANKMAGVYRENIFPHLKVGLLTGRMSAKEKEETMSRFLSGQFQVLVATTVIEVGVDVSNATLMVVENAERFGLFQLHQLRGRVGRGQKESTCILMAGENIGDEARDRLNTIVSTSSGFCIAETDLRVRGPGDFLGVRQSGLPCFRFADPFRDARILEWARDCAQKILSDHRQLPRPLSEKVNEFWSRGLEIKESG